MDEQKQQYRFAKYMRISNEIALRLQAGAHTEGDFFLSRDELAAQYGISPTTASSVLRELAARGLLQTRKGRRAILRIKDFSAERAAVFRGTRIAFLSSDAFPENPVGDALLFFLRHKLAAAGAELMTPSPVPPNGADALVRLPGAPPIPFEFKNLPTVFCGMRPPRPNSVAIVPVRAAALAALHIAERRIDTVFDLFSPHPNCALFRRPGKPPLGSFLPRSLLPAADYRPRLVDPNRPFLDQLFELLRRELAARSRALVLVDDPNETIALSDFLREERWPFPSCSILGVVLRDCPCLFPTVNLRIDSLATAILLSLATSFLGRPAAPLLHVPDFVNPVRNPLEF